MPGVAEKQRSLSAAQVAAQAKMRRRVPAWNCRRAYSRGRPTSPVPFASKGVGSRPRAVRGESASAVGSAALAVRISLLISQAADQRFLNLPYSPNPLREDLRVRCEEDVESVYLDCDLAGRHEVRPGPGRRRHARPSATPGGRSVRNSPHANFGWRRHRLGAEVTLIEVRSDRPGSGGVCPQAAPATVRPLPQPPSQQGPDPHIVSKPMDVRACRAPAGDDSGSSSTTPRGAS